MGFSNLDQEDLKELSRRTGQACVGFNLRKASRLLMRLYDEAFEPLGLKGTQFSLLMAVVGNNGAAIGELAQPLGMERSTLSRNITVLQKKGLVTVEEGEDRRQQRISITDSGVSVLQKAQPLWQGVQERLACELGEERIKNLLEDLKSLSQLFKGK
ncbi:transcriptional regulator SlyA [Sporotomaculum syntrophicum]|uniref:Transcriptional regulator SlyA n=1 Tax=Sporotomaculum syntrophicum TaxID=182264 RepID=A0A9D2WND1_9FIRM|nr:MarR family winged helix-turn-helix transcriptional regulator [Sporotomaculum syntrophicum]KAF1083926.1 transcriptional regulator SlyA [Sporotomaculum syntrophicum]